MAGLLPVITTTQKPRVSGYTKRLLETAEAQYGVESHQYKGIYNQYFRMPSQDVSLGQNTRHFDALMSDAAPTGLERLYRRVVVLDLLSACASECVFCVRGMYDPHTLRENQLDEVAHYLANEPELREVLVTGGDPLLTPKLLGALAERLAVAAPHITTIRIGTRLPVQDPGRITEVHYELLRTYRDRFLFEIALQVNHPFELQPETREVLRMLQVAGARLYSQNVLLKGVNDDLDILVELYDQLRAMRLIPYYFYHAVPMVGTDEFRTSIAKGLDLARQLTSCGQLSGMAKPMFTIMTDVGKVTLYDGSLLSKCGGGREIQVRTAYRLEDRLQWNPGYQLPASAVVNEVGTLDVTYIDGDT